MELQLTPTGGGFVPTAPPALGGAPATGQSNDSSVVCQSCSCSLCTGKTNDRSVQAALESELTPEEQRKLQELRQRDTEVRNHEQAHVAAGGQYVTRAPTYEYEIGPDGRRYAVGGEVKIDVSEVPDDPEATIEKARVVQRAALAPVDPSPQDRQVAADAAVMEREARAELREQRMEEMREALEAATAEEPNSADAPQTQIAGLSGAMALEQRIADFFLGPPSQLNVLA